MTQEQCTHRNNVQSSEKPQVYKVGIYGWRKRCLYFFVLLLMILILINLALTIWILKVMNFTIDGMGNLRITEKGLKLEGDSEFLQPLYAKEIQSKPGRPLFLQSSRNVSVNIVNSNNQLLTQLVTGSSGFKARGKMFEVKSTSGKLLFSADEQEVVVGAERLRVMGGNCRAANCTDKYSIQLTEKSGQGQRLHTICDFVLTTFINSSCIFTLKPFEKDPEQICRDLCAEGAVFSKSVETPHVRAEPFKELRLESPTRSLLMEAPKGIQILAEAGDIQAICRNELRLESKDGEDRVVKAQISLDARRIRLMRLPEGKASTSSSSSGTRQTVYE
ncbi:hypothetical protein L3Q82_022463, partial [Scortum barcoo]